MEVIGSFVLLHPRSLTRRIWVSKTTPNCQYLGGCATEERKPLTLQSSRWRGCTYKDAPQHAQTLPAPGCCRGWQIRHSADGWLSCSPLARERRSGSWEAGHQHHSWLSGSHQQFWQVSHNNNEIPWSQRFLIANSSVGKLLSSSRCKMNCGRLRTICTLRINLYFPEKKTRCYPPWKP